MLRLNPAGTRAVTVGEARTATLESFAEPLHDDPARGYIDFRELGRREAERKAKLLLPYAVDRGRFHLQEAGCVIHQRLGDGPPSLWEEGPSSLSNAARCMRTRRPIRMEGSSPAAAASSAARSGRNRPPNPEHSGHLFRLIPATTAG